MKYLMIIGAPKCGTTSLAAWLGGHPEIIMSNPKEPKFWECEYQNGMDWYIETYFKDGLSRAFKGKATVFGEARVYNFAITYVPQRVIREFNPANTRIILMTRNPVERFISDYWNWRNMRPGREPLTIEKAFEANLASFDLNALSSEEAACGNCDQRGGRYRRLYLEHGCYSYYKKFWNVFPFHTVNIGAFALEKIKRARMLDFIGVDSSYADRVDFPQIRTGDYPNVSLKIAAKLSDFYERILFP